MKSIKVPGVSHEKSNALDSDGSALPWRAGSMHGFSRAFRILRRATTKVPEDILLGE